MPFANQARYGPANINITIYNMSLEYYLIPNRMTDNPNDYCAISRNIGSYDMDDVYDQMTREGSTITKAEALAAFEEITRAIISILERGHKVVTPFVNITTSVNGVFDGKKDSFDDSRHRISLNINSGIRLRDLSSSITPTKVRKSEPTPIIDDIYDNVSETENNLLTPGEGARISGDLLKYDEEDNQQGIFFIHTEDGTEHRVERSLLRNMPKELIFTLPDLPAGEYRLEVRSILPGTSNIRVDSLSGPLTVEASGS